MSEPSVWPAGIQAAAAITVDFEGESVEQQEMALPLWGRYSHGRYGAQVGDVQPARPLRALRGPRDILHRRVGYGALSPGYRGNRGGGA